MFQAISVSSDLQWGEHGRSYSLENRVHLIRRPPICLPAIEITPLCPRVHHEVDRTTASKRASTRYDRLAARELRGLVTLVEQCRFGCGLQVLQVEYRVDNVWYIFVVRAALDHKDTEVWRRFGDARGDDASRCAT
jgi:hypothetical protein